MRSNFPRNVPILSLLMKILTPISQLSFLFKLIYLRKMY